MKRTILTDLNQLAQEEDNKYPLVNFIKYHLKDMVTERELRDAIQSYIVTKGARLETAFLKVVEILVINY